MPSKYSKCLSSPTKKKNILPSSKRQTIAERTAPKKQVKEGISGLPVVRGSLNPGILRPIAAAAEKAAAAAEKAAAEKAAAEEAAEGTTKETTEGNTKRDNGPLASNESSPENKNEDEGTPGESANQSLTPHSNQRRQSSATRRYRTSPQNFEKLILAHRIENVIWDFVDTLDEKSQEEFQKILNKVPGFFL